VGLIRNSDKYPEAKMEMIKPPKFEPKGKNLVVDWREFQEEFDLWLACRFNAGISSLRNSVQKRSYEAT
jgi:hypothetical protein